MAFQLQKFKAYGVRCSGSTRQQVAQVAELYITALNTDTALDISSDTAGSLGTFWTAVTADATYGALATNALAVIQKIIPQVVSLKTVESEAVLNRVNVTTLTSGSQYTIATTNHLPSIAYNSGNAPTVQHLKLTWTTMDNVEAVVADYGAAF